MSHKIKAIECILDWNLWPRHSAQKLDTANIRQMKESLEAGLPLPPIVIDKDSMRVVDGFHRLTAVLDLQGDEADIEADVRYYESEREMFLDAVRLNAHQGKMMTPMDRAYSIIKARRMKIPAPMVAEALGMLPDAMKEFLEKRSAMVESTGERIPLAYGASHLSAAEHGEALNDEQEHFARTATGSVFMMHVRQVLNGAKADALKLTDKDVELLRETRDAIEALIRSVK